MVKVTFKRKKESCPYYRACCDYRRSKDVCHDNDWVYCITFTRLNIKQKGGKKLSNGNT